MASSSSIIPITPIQRKYDVFISFSGRHIRDNFLSHLRSALFGEKIVSFAEDNIRRGDDISKSLSRTIKESQISIIIFSKNYSSSRWCLGELEKIMKCNQKNGQFVIPIFLNVKPADVENQSGRFGQALAQYEGHPKIQVWRAAFTKAARLAGWDSKVTRPQARLVKNIVYDVLSKLYFTSPNNFRNFVGVRYHIEQFESSLIMVQQMFNNGLDRISDVPLLNDHAFRPEHPLNGHHMRLSKREINYSSSSFSQMKYDVYLSFRGADTRNNFSGHVYAALRREKIQTFIDHDLQRGDVVSDSLFRTISESKISFVIFSENYASSRWCLDELVRIMECRKQNGQIVIPVFYKVDPSHVRTQSGPFGQALARYEGHPKIQKWKDALTEAANLTGWDFEVTRHEATLIESIVTDTLGKLSKTSSSRNYSEACTHDIENRHCCSVVPHSPCAYPTQMKYDVYLSFRGADTRNTFSGHVYAALRREKIQTFIDHDLQRGDVVSDSLFRTISESKISVVIFSENYASSSGCLDELVRIMECRKENGQIVIPVFYKVDPSHVRKQSGPFAQALAWYEGHPKIQKWKDALTEAANLIGWDYEVTRHEATLIESIVTDTLGKLSITSSSRNYSRACTHDIENRHGCSVVQPHSPCAYPTQFLNLDCVDYLPVWGRKKKRS